MSQHQGQSLYVPCVRLRGGYAHLVHRSEEERLEGVALAVTVPLTPDNTGMALPEWWKVRAPHSHIRMSVATDPSFYLPQDACGRLHARAAHAAEPV